MRSDPRFTGKDLMRFYCDNLDDEGRLLFDGLHSVGCLGSDSSVGTLLGNLLLLLSSDYNELWEAVPYGSVLRGLIEFVAEGLEGRGGPLPDIPDELLM